VKYEANKLYKTRSGHKAIIFMADNGMGKMLGAIQIATDWWMSDTWYFDGKILQPLGQTFPEFDLVSEWDAAEVGAAYHAGKLRALTSMCDDAVLLAKKNAEIAMLRALLRDCIIYIGQENISGISEIEARIEAALAL
jgi:hypothetical protein